jgi:hypothetical protein
MTNDVYSYADDHRASEFRDPTKVEKARHTNNSTFRSQTLQYGKIKTKWGSVFLPNSPRTNSIYFIDVRLETEL